MNFDVVIIGAGPAGLSMALSLADTDLKIAIIDQQAQTKIESPEYDGREIALTHESRNELTKLGVWQDFSSDDCHKMNGAKVFNGDSSSSLDFDELPNNKSELGYIISNHLIRSELFSKSKDLPNLTFYFDTTIKNFYSSASEASVITQDGKKIKSKLVIAADSRFSKLRGLMGMPAKFDDFARTAMVFKVKHSKPHEHTAFEFFNYGHTIAILPLADNESSIVITVDTDKASQFSEMHDENLMYFVEKSTRGKLGTVQSITKRFSYPLIGAIASKFVNHRCAVIGDAAVGMHPVTAHGYNLGLQSAAILSKHIKRAIKSGDDIGSIETLRHYQSEHMRNSKLMYQGTNFVVRLFTNELAPIKLAREAVLSISNKLPPLKFLITNKLTRSN